MLLSSLGIPKRGLISASSSSNSNNKDSIIDGGDESSHNGHGSSGIMSSGACRSSGGRGAPELRIRREIRTEAGSMRSACYVNGTATSLRVLRELGSALVDVNGQNSAQSLR